MGGGEGGPEESGAVPTAAISAVGETLATVDDLCSHLHRFLSLADRDVLAELPPLHRARAFLLPFVLQHLVAPLRPSTRLNSQAATRFIGHSLPDLTPGTQAHFNSLLWIIPLLLLDSNRRHVYVSEQRQSLRDISRGDFVRIRSSDNHRAKKKRKQQKPEKPSARAAAQEFLEKAARELCGASELGLKGPLQEISDEEDEQIG
ncbi:hypothetical protein GW17_00052781 [Ensete ventricosum]|nr:hypothetical protein GW17_00052781 [Ensete ventricosum]RZR95509.1 hypothetical protein BHM03_00024370 [Ensete ventricosum]